MALQI